MLQFPQNTGGGPEGKDPSGFRRDSEGLLLCQGWGGEGVGSVQPWGEVMRSAGSTAGGGCSWLRRCTREIGQQEAAVGNAGTGNSRCCLDLHDSQPRCLPPLWELPRDGCSKCPGLFPAAQGLP